MESKSSQLNLRLAEQKVKTKLGREEFFSKGTDINIHVLDFWKWSGSNLLINTTRGVLAEFLVASSLGLVNEPRNNWDSYDIELKSGVKIEVKSAAKYQAWKQTKQSRIEFGISKRKEWNSKTGESSDKPIRAAHIYVFCVLNDFEPLNLDEWDFYVLLTERINERCSDQAKISLTSLKKNFQSGLKKCRFNGLKSTIEVEAGNVPLCRVNSTETI